MRETDAAFAQIANQSLEQIINPYIEDLGEKCVPKLK